MKVLGYIDVGTTVVQSPSFSDEQLEFCSDYFKCLVQREGEYILIHERVEPDGIRGMIASYIEQKGEW